MQGLVPEGDDSWGIHTAYQVDDEVWVIDLESSGFMTPGFIAPSNVVDFGCPAIMVTKVTNTYVAADLPDEDLIYSSHGDPVRAYDYSVGDGWINSETFGWCWVGQYPWVWICNDGEWVYMSSTGPIELNDRVGNSWWMWSEDSGWYWAAPDITSWQWNIDEWAWIIPRD
jgi:hypothetical protein